MAEDFLCPERDELFTYSGLDLLLKRYVIQSRSRVPLETPQEMFLGANFTIILPPGIPSSSFFDMTPSFNAAAKYNANGKIDRKRLKAEYAQHV